MTSSRHASDRLIVALDARELASALAMARQLRGLVRTLKVGSILFTACGPMAIRRLRALGFEVMLDLKWFDIPSTVDLSCRAAVQHRVSLLTVHASGGQGMLNAVVRGVREEARRARVPRPSVLAVTVLTSVGRSGTARSITPSVLRLARVALAAGCDGVVASADEARALRRRFGTRLRIACPGIRLSEGSHDDQRRVATPARALMNGADWLIVGRPITAAQDVRAAAQHLLHEMKECEQC